MSKFWDGFSQSFFQQAQTAVQNERNRRRDARDDERFDREKAQWAQQDEDRKANLDFADFIRNGQAERPLTFAPQDQGYEPGQGALPSMAAAVSGEQAPMQMGLRLPEQPAPDASLLRRKAPTADEVTTRAAGLAARRGDSSGAASAFALAGEQRKQATIDDVSARVAKMTPDEVYQTVAQVNGTKDVPFVMLDVGKDGAVMRRTDDKGVPIGAPFTVPVSQARQIVQGYMLTEAGLGSAGMALIAGAHKEIGDYVNKRNDETLRMAGFNEQVSNNRAQRGLQARQLDLSERRLDEAALGTPIPIVNKKTGEIALWTPPKRGASGLTTLPEGYSFTNERRAYSEADVAKYADLMVGKPVQAANGNPVLENGKPKVYSLQEARREAVAMLEGKSSASNPGFTVGGDVAANLQKLAAGSDKPATKPQPAPSKQEMTVPDWFRSQPENSIRQLRGQGAVIGNERYPTMQAAEAAQRQAYERFLQEQQSGGQRFNASRGGLNAPSSFDASQYINPKF